MSVKPKSKILVIGFQPFDEKMYPHTYDFLELIGGYCDLTYYGGDDRGVKSLNIGLQLSSIGNALSHPLTVWNTISHYLFETKRIRKEIKELMSQHFDVVIAIDHSALNYASDFIEKGTKFIFWSYDIISEDHDWRKSYWIRKLLKENRNKIHRCDLIMVQDRNRRAVLNSVLGSHNIPNFYLPVSLKHRDITRKSLPRGKAEIILMQAGSIHRLRASDQLIEYYQTMEEKVSLVLQGHIDQTIQIYIENMERKPQLYPVANRLEELRAKISEADLGFIANSSKDINDYYYSKCSGQFIEFIMQGIPVITYDSEDLGTFVEENKCGVYIRKIEEIDSAIEEICADYVAFSGNAKNTFFRFFDIEAYGGKIKEILVN